MDNEHNGRTLMQRAKYAGPMWFGIFILILGVTSILVLGFSPAAPIVLTEIGTLVGTIVTALGGLGIVIGTGSTVHDTFRDAGVSKAKLQNGGHE